MYHHSSEFLQKIGERFPENHLRIFRSYSAAGEWGELVEGMCASLIKREIPITPEERDSFAELLALIPYQVEEYPHSSKADETLASLVIDPDAGLS